MYVASSFCVHMVHFGRFKERSWKAVTRTDSRLSYSESDILSVMHILGYNIATFGSVLHSLLKLKNKGNFFSTFFITKNYKKNIDAGGGLEVTRAETGNYCISFLALC